MKTRFFCRQRSATARAMAEFGDVEDHVDTLRVQPAAGDGGADIGLVLVVAEDHADRRAVDPAGVGRRELRRQHRAAALVVE
jgi:hypothetical protein